MSARSEPAFGDQMTGRLPSAMPLVHQPQKLFEIERLALARIERTDALVDFQAQSTELLDMREKPLPDLFLICFRQVRHFGDSPFETLDHVWNVSGCGYAFQHRSPGVPGG